MTPPRTGPLNAVDRLRKLRAMPAGEIWTRLRYETYCRLERARHVRRSLPDPNGLHTALIPTLRHSASWRSSLLIARSSRQVRFFNSVEQCRATRTQFLTRFSDERARAREEAERALRGEFQFFGSTFLYPGRIDWHLDPVTRVEWPKLYHRDMPVHGGDVGFGDVKFVWELGRHQFLIDLAKMWAIDRLSAGAAAARRIILDWRRENPVGTGVGWSCSLEPAFRALSWLWAYFLTLDDPGFDDDSHIDWLAGFHDHGWFLYRHLEYYTSPYNHLIGEACALYCLGVLFPEFHESSRWRRRGRHILESRLRAQFYADGGSVEQSTFYHHATTGFYILAALIGRENGEEFSPAVWAAIERAIEFSMLMQQPDGTTPRIGGADDGKPIRLEHLPLWDFRPYLAVGAVLFGRPDFKACAGRIYEDALWLLGPDGVAKFDALEARLPASASSSRVLKSSGYVVIRGDSGRDASYLCFDCGEQAAGLRRDAVPSAAHGHADCLSIILWRHGHPVLVDSGFHCYNGPKSWQDHFRETAAHNTVRIDGHDQAQHVTKMAWTHTYTATLEGHNLAGPNCWAIASHDGYRRLERGPVVHRRAVWTRERGYIVLADFLDGTGTHNVELIFQFAPGALCVSAGEARYDRRVALHWFSATELTHSVYEGGATPDAGWIAPSLGVKTAAPRLVLAGRVRLPTTIVTVITDLVPELIDVSSATDAPGPLCVSNGNWSDWVLVKGYGDGSAYGLQTDGLAAAWIHRDGKFIADGQVGRVLPHA